MTDDLVNCVIDYCGGQAVTQLVAPDPVDGRTIVSRTQPVGVNPDPLTQTATDIVDQTAQWAIDPVMTRRTMTDPAEPSGPVLVDPAQAQMRLTRLTRTQPSQTDDPGQLDGDDGVIVGQTQPEPSPEDPVDRPLTD